MAVTLMDIQKYTINLLNECFDTTAMDLRAGGSGGATIPGITPASSSTLSTMMQLVNECSADLARSCVPVGDTGTYTWPSGIDSVLLSLFTCSVSGNKLWIPHGVMWGSTPLMFAAHETLERSNCYTDPILQATGTPKYWYIDGNINVAVYPVPSTQGTATIAGYVVPSPITSDAGTVSWLPDDLALHMHAWYCADMIARKNMEDQSLAARSDDWREWRYLYDLTRMDLWSKVPIALRYTTYPTPPMPIKPDVLSQSNQPQAQG